LKFKSFKIGILSSSQCSNKVLQSQTTHPSQVEP
jgi:hypothetical protein